MPQRRRNAYRRRAYRPRVSKALRRKYRARKAAKKSGFLSLKRKMNLINIYQGTTLGTIGVSDPTTSCLTMGAPVLVTGTTNCYNVPFVMKFRLSQMINSTDITNFADSYKIVSALVKIHNNYNNVNTANNVLLQPYIEYVQDYDDATVPPSVTLFREKMGIRTKYFSASKPSIGMGVRPKFRVNIGGDFAAGTGVFAEVGGSKWLNTTFPDVDHFGIKGVLHNVFLPGGGTNIGSVFDVEATLHVLARDFQ